MGDVPTRIQHFQDSPPRLIRSPPSRPPVGAGVLRLLAASLEESPISEPIDDDKQSGSDVERAASATRVGDERRSAARRRVVLFMPNRQRRRRRDYVGRDRSAHQNVLLLSPVCHVGWPRRDGAGLGANLTAAVASKSLLAGVLVITQYRVVFMATVWGPSNGLDGATLFRRSPTAFRANHLTLSPKTEPQNPQPYEIFNIYPQGVVPRFEAGRRLRVPTPLLAPTLAERDGGGHRRGCAGERARPREPPRRPRGARRPAREGRGECKICHSLTSLRNVGTRHTVLLSNILSTNVGIGKILGIGQRTITPRSHDP